jgi:DNA-binding LacI/PurR family transcriptional regulator
MNVLETVEELGLEVPGDVSIVGFDNIQVAGLKRVSLTTIAQPFEDLARIGIELLLEGIAGVQSRPRQHLLEPTLVVRDSTAPPLRRQRQVADDLPGV